MPTTPAASGATGTRPPTPSATPSSTLTASALFSDDFGSQQASLQNGWTLTSTATYAALWSPGNLTCSVKEKNTSRSFTRNAQYDNVAAETEAQRVGSGYAAYGLTLRNTGEGAQTTAYLFEITTAGQYRLRKAINGKFIAPPLVDNTASPQIKQGDARNVLGVIADGGTISLYINRALVKTVTDTSITGKGRVGLVVGTDNNTAASTVAFSKLILLTPERARAEWKP